MPLSSCIVVLEPLPMSHLSVAERTTAAARAYADAFAWRRMYGAAVSAMFRSYQVIGLYRSRLRRACSLYACMTATRLQHEQGTVWAKISAAEVALRASLRSLRVAKLRRATMPKIVMVDSSRDDAANWGSDGGGAAASKVQTVTPSSRVSIATSARIVPFEMAQVWPLRGWGHDAISRRCAPRTMEDGVEIYRYAGGTGVKRARFVGDVPLALRSSPTDLRPPTLLATDAKYFNATAADALTLHVAKAEDLARDFSLSVRRTAGLHGGVEEEPERMWLLVAIYTGSRRPKVSGSFLSFFLSFFLLELLLLFI